MKCARQWQLRETCRPGVPGQDAAMAPMTPLCIFEALNAGTALAVILWLEACADGKLL